MRLGPNIKLLPLRALALAPILIALFVPAVHAQAPPAGCAEATVVAAVEADSWIDLNSPLANKGSDAVLDVSGDTRALVRFPLPAEVPAGCVLESARLRVYADSGTEGARVEAVRLASGWSESTVNWTDQPAPIGSAVAAWSTDGYMAWNVTAQVREMIGGVNHGWLLRDAAEGTETAGGHGFYSREKGESPPELVLRFAAPPTGEPRPPEPPTPGPISCGELITRSIQVTNDLLNCPADGLSIGASRVIIDLDGHTIDGVGLGTGIRNEGYGEVTVRNGTVTDFDHGVKLLAETALNVVDGLTLRHNEVAGVELFDADDGNEIRDSLLEDNGGGLLMLSGTTGTIVSDNTMTLNSGAAMMIRDSDGNRLEDNRVVGGGDLGVGLERATGNVLVDNVVAGTSDGGIELLLASHGNRVERNLVTDAGDTGIMVKESDRNDLVANTTQGMSDSGITLQTANDGVVSGNDLGANPGGLQMDGSSRNVVSGNAAVGGGGIGIELGGGSYGNTIAGNTTSANGAQGIYVSDESLIDPLMLDPSNFITGNTANGNGADGITVPKGGHVIADNVTRDNRAWGINAAILSIDGGRNAASGNSQVAQCLGVVCKVEWNPPETTIDDHPPDSTRSSSATFAFSGADDMSTQSELRFECRLYQDDAEAFAPCTNPQSFTGLSTGSYTFEVRTVDAADNVDPTPASFSWSIDATPPETSIDSGPPDPTNSSSATFTFSADEAGSTFECSLDGAPFAACASEYGDLADGRHTFDVRATDRAGNTDPSPASYAWTVDTTPPETSVDSGPADPTNSTSASFEFSADDEGATFECSLDGAPFGACAAEYTDLGDGEHTFSVRATDRAGNTDASPASYAWIVDTTAPETTINAGPGDPTNSASARFEYSADEAGSTFECSLDGAPFGACAAEYADLGDGEHMFRVRATDRAGNTDASAASYAWTVDTTPPETSIDSGPADPANSASATFEFSADEAGSTFECSLDDAPYDACATEYRDLADGRHTFRVRATDVAGNTDPTPASHSWTVDTTPPQTTIDSAPADPTNSTSARFEFSANEAGATFECSLDAAPFGDCASEYADLADGEHTFRVRATDRAGNTDPTPASHSWTIDTTPPDTSIDSAPPALTNRATASFEFSSNEAGSTFECSLDDAPFTECAAEYAGLADGEHSFRVRATDRAGNTDASPASYSWTIDTTAPQTSIDSGPAALTNSTSANFTFSANEPGSTFECSLDGAPFGDCAMEYTDLGDGEHTFRVRATDRAGNTDATPASYSWTIDTTAPQTSIDSGPAALTNSTSANFTFSANEPGSTFECSLDGAPFGDCAMEYTDLGDGEHTFRVRATDRAGNTDATPASYSWTIDTTAPQTSIDSGPAALTNSTSASFTFSANEPGSSFECSLDGAPFGACGPYSDLAEGDHTFRVRATDRAGNTDATPASYSWTIDTTAPQTSIDTGPDALTNSTSANFTFSANEPGSSFECSLDGAPFGACGPYSDLAEGDHTFRVRATDRAGNTDATPASYSWTIDTTAPQTSIDTGPDALTNSTSANFTFSANEPGSSFECSLDGAPFGACGPYSDLAEGDHTFRVRATDRAGNTDPTPASYSWTIDTTAPQTSIDSGPAALTNSTSASFTFSANEAGSTFECSLDGAAYGACGPYSELADGEHTFRVRATDRAGNTDPTPAIHEWEVRTDDPAPDTTPPDTSIDSGPADPTNSTSASFTFSADEPGATFECSLDNAAFTACASPQPYSGLASGTHNFRVRARDAAGNVDATPASRSWTIDTTAPQTTIGNAPASPTTSTSASFTFTSEAGATFECSLDNAAFTACASPQQYSGLADGSRNFRVRARDAAGNVDATPASHTWTIDSTAPQTTINTGPNAQTTSTSASFTFSSETGATFECSLDNAAFVACTSPRQHTGLAAGTHNFRVRARDAAGNVDATPASHTWTIDNTAPQTTINTGPPSPTNSTSASFSFSSSETGSTFECSLDNAAFVVCTSPRQLTGLSAGTHTLRVRARDAAGNLDATPASRSWTIDTTAPQTTIGNAPASPTGNTAASFTFTSETGATFECSLDNAAFTACASPQQYSGLAAGTHNFRVRARDVAGNVDATPASHNWTIESAGTCATATLPATADAWIDQNSPSSNKGTDSVLKVQSKGPSDNFRALVRFAVPQSPPAGCVLSSATLRLFAGSARTGRTLHALRLTSSWTENLVTWSNQPQTAGAAAAVASGTGYREWNVTAQVQEGAGNGFLIRDAVEGADAEQQFHSREKGQSPPQLVLRYVPGS